MANPANRTTHPAARLAALATALLAVACTQEPRTARLAGGTPPPVTTPGTPAAQPPTPATLSPTTAPAVTTEPGDRRTLTEALLDPADLPYPKWRQRSQGRGYRANPLDPCGGTAYPAERARLAGVWRVLAPPGDEVPEGGATSQDVHGYPSATAAEAAQAGYRRAVRTCRTHTERHGSSSVEVTHTVVNESPLLVERTYRTTSGPTASLYPDYVVVARRDSYVTIVAMSFGEGPNRDGARRLMRLTARELCAATSGAGCQ